MRTLFDTGVEGSNPTGTTINTDAWFDTGDTHSDARAIRCVKDD